jgi:hypothetical protein
MSPTSALHPPYSKSWKAERNRLVEADLADTVICSRCGATLATYSFPESGGKCVAELDDRCPGFASVEAALQRANEKMGAQQ